MTHRCRDPLPTPGTIVFAAALHRNNVQALRECNAEAMMVSFEYIRSNPQALHDRWNTPVWPARRYLDSGLFSVMTRLGLMSKSIQSHRTASQRGASPEAALTKLADDYVAYLQQHAEQWDHIIELDTALVLGAGSTEYYRARLVDVVGERLLPVWHFTEPESAWEALCDAWPYVAIGGIVGNPSAQEQAYCRYLIERAHARGAIVHGLGIGRPRDFLASGWDTGDCTTYINGPKYGIYGTVRYSSKDVGIIRARAYSSRQLLFEAWVRSLGIDPAELLKTGNSTPAKFFVAIRLMQEQQKRIRRVYAERRGPTPETPETPNTPQGVFA